MPDSSNDSVGLNILTNDETRVWGRFQVMRKYFPQFRKSKTFTDICLMPHGYVSQQKSGDKSFRAFWRCWSSERCHCDHCPRGKVNPSRNVCKRHVWGLFTTTGIFPSSCSQPPCPWKLRLFPLFSRQPVLVNTALPIINHK